MKDDDIAKLFGRVAAHFKDSGEGSQRMFSMLVKTTLKFRDMVFEKTGIPLTVGETKQALEVFMEVLKTKKIPKNLDKNVHDLLILWLEEIKILLH